MKTIYALLIFFIGSLNIQAAEDPKDVKSSIKEVTVFAKGAQVNRNAKARIPAGNSLILFSGIAPGIDKNSIQVKAEGDFVVLSVTHRLNHFESPLETSKISQLINQRDTLQVKIDDENMLMQVLGEEESLILTNKNLSGKEKGVDIDQLKETAAFYRSRLKSIRLEKLRLARKLKGLRIDLGKLNNQLAELNVTEKKITSEILVAINSERSTQGDFTISYLVPNAGWTPHYDFRVKDINNPVQLAYKAKVYQNSGESWEKVNLTLSTGDPSLTGQKPTLNPWRLDFYNPYAYQKNQYSNDQSLGNYNPNVRRVNGVITDGETGEALIGASVFIKETGTGTVTDFDGRYALDVPAYGKTLVISYTGYSNTEVAISQSNMSLSLQGGVLLESVVVTGYAGQSKLKSLFKKKDRKQSREEIISKAIPIEEVEKATSVSFKIELPYDIPTDGKPYDVSIKQHELEAYYEYYCAPKLDEDAFLTALVTGWEEYNLLSGQASLFFEGTYLGKSYLDVQSVNDTLELSLGRDKNIVVKRTRKKQQTKKKFLSGKRVDTRSWDIEVRNKKKANINIVIEDQIPIAINNEIEIEHSFDRAAFDKDSGILTWKFTLPTQQTKKLDFKYTVKYPKKEQVRLE